MSKAKAVTVYVCDDCGVEHQTQELALACEAEHREDKEFAALLERFNVLREEVQSRCKHKNSRVTNSEYTVINQLDDRGYEDTHYCRDCSKVWTTARH